MSDKERAKDLFLKGTQCYQEKNYAEALKYFQASDRIKSTEKTATYIESCKRRLMNNNQKPNGSASTSNGSSTTSSSEDAECEKIIKNKNYYDILKVTKDSPIEDIKKAYKRLAIKFHPDKNRSPKAEEAFKKIATAYQTLTDEEKKKMYDRYGTEEEYREKYYQAHQQQYEEEIDPYEILNMFFSGGRYNPRNRTQRYQQQYYYQGNNDENNNHRANPQNVRLMGLIQILPIVIIFGGYILSSLFTTVPLYQFEKSYDYHSKKRTSINKIEYFVGDTFISTYPNVKSIKESGIEIKIEHDYLNYLKEKCQDMMRYKSELEMQMSYYRYNQYYRNQINNKLQQIKYESCHKYQELVRKIR